MACLNDLLTFESMDDVASSRIKNIRVETNAPNKMKLIVLGPQRLLAPRSETFDKYPSGNFHDKGMSPIISGKLL